MKEIEVTKDFLSLEESVIGCQNEGSIDDCETRKYVDVLLSQCKCLPFSIRQSDEVKTLLSIICPKSWLPPSYNFTTLHLTILFCLI